MSATLASLLDEWDEHLILERSLTDHTRRAYRFDLGKYIEYCREKLTREATIEDQHEKLVRSYLAHCSGDKQLKAATVARMIAAMRVFFRWCLRAQHIKLNPMAHIQNPKRPRKLPVYLVETEVTSLLQTPDRTEEFGARDYAIMVTLTHTGVRLQELVKINLDDICFNQRVIKVFGKGSKERQIPLNRPAEEAIRGYLAFRKQAEGEQALFVNRFGRRLSGRSVENIVKKYVKLSGIKKNVSPHKLRHTFATTLHNQSVDLLEIKTLLGHQNISTTQIYTNTNPSRLRAAVNKLDHMTGSGNT